MPDAAWVLWVLCLKYIVSLAIGVFNLWDATKGDSNSLQCFGSLLVSPDQELIREFPMPGIGDFLVCG